MKEDISAKIQEWITKRPFWIRNALYDLLNGEGITDEKILEYTSLVNEEAKGITHKGNMIMPELLADSSLEDPVSLLAIKKLNNVNAIDNNAELKFEPKGISIIYGYNGSGKSGYVRSLKKAFGTPYSEKISGNIFLHTASKKQSCTVDISSLGEGQRSIECDLSENSKAVISGIDVFDTRISQAYIGETKEASYEPRIFSVLYQLAQLSDLIKSNIQKELSSIDISLPILPNEISQHPLVASLNSINSKTKKQSYVMKWDESEEQKYKEIQHIYVDSSPKKTIDLIEKKLVNLGFLKKHLENINEFLSNINIDNINESISLYNSLVEERKAIKDVFSVECESSDEFDLNSNIWEKLWQYAKKYSVEKNINTHEEKSKCPLCHQPMSGKVLARYISIEQFVNSSINDKINFEKTKVKALLSPPFKILSDEDLELLLLNCQFDEKEQLEVKAQINRYANLVIRMESVDFESDKSIEVYAKIDLSEIILFINYHIDKSFKMKEKYLLQLDEFQNSETKKEIEDFQARKFIFTNIERIYKAIDLSLKKDELNKAISLTSTYSITALTKSLATDLLSHDYEEGFNKELALLTGGAIKVKLKEAKGGKGRVPFKLIITDDTENEYEPNIILSEGEKRVVSLAAFFADTSLGNKTSALIFDDPISSLDDLYEEKTIQRLVKLAASRQVIVFTHRLTMVYDLDFDCKKNGIPCYEQSIFSTPNKKGIPTFGVINDSNPKKLINNLLDVEIKKLEDISTFSPDYIEIQSPIGCKFRNAIEKSIEDILLCGVVIRFSKVIRSNNILQLKKMSTDDCDFIDKMMTKYSRFNHSQPYESPLQPIEYEEMKSDISAFKKWIEQYNKRSG